MTDRTVDTELRARRLDYLGDWAISLVLLAVMAGAFVIAQDWPANTAFFPELLSGVGAVLLLYKIGLLAFGERPSRRLAEAALAAERKPSAAAEGDKAIAIGGSDDDEEGDVDELHAIFTSAGLRTWAAVLGWLALFLVGMHLFGLILTLPVFTVIYLRVVAKSSWLLCLLYVLGTAGVIYLLFVWFLHLPLPEGILIDGLS